ncbi:hypothetical protein FRC17_004064, partial [Serendipita sp. 399]
ECSPMGFRHPQVESITTWEIDERRKERAKAPVHAINLRVLRLLDDDRDPTQLLRANTNLEALWIPYMAFTVAYEPGWVAKLSHLHLHNVIDDGNVYRLELPQLVYLRLNMHLKWQQIRYLYVYPLVISMPNVTTVYIDGDIYKEYLASMNTMILDARHTIVNLLLGSPECARFVWEKLVEFPRLETIGIYSTTFWKRMWSQVSAYPLPSSSSLSLILLGIDSHSRSSKWGLCTMIGVHLIEMVSRPGKWVGKVVVPFIWEEMEPLWVKAYHAKQHSDEALPCCWPCLEHMDSHSIRIEDRNGVGLREGEGAAFSSRMRTFTHKVGAWSDDEA